MYPHRHRAKQETRVEEETILTRVNWCSTRKGTFVAEERRDEARTLALLIFYRSYRGNAGDHCRFGDSRTQI